MRIVHLTKYLPPFRGGIELATAELSLAGQALGAQVEVYGVAKEPYRGNPDGIEYRPVACRFHVGPAPVATGFWRLFDHMLGADVVHVHMPNPMAELTLLELARRRQGRERPKLIPMPHAPVQRFAAFGRSWERLVQRPLLGIADGVLLATPQMLDTYAPSRPYTSKVRLLPYPLRRYTGTLLPPPRSATFELFAVGRHVPYKGFDVLLDALPRLHGDWHLVLAGKGPETEHLKRRARSLGLEARVEFVGDVDEPEKHSLIAASDLVVVPSRTVAEAFGLVIAEAFTHRKAVVTTRLPTGVGFLARSGRCGAAVAPGSPSELATAIQRLMDDPELRETAGRENYEFWQRELRVEVFQQRYAEILASILSLPQTARVSMAS